MSRGLTLTRYSPMYRHRVLPTASRVCTPSSIFRHLKPLWRLLQGAFFLEMTIGYSRVAGIRHQRSSLSYFIHAVIALANRSPPRGSPCSPVIQTAKQNARGEAEARRHRGQSELSGRHTWHLGYEEPRRTRPRSSAAHDHHPFPPILRLSSETSGKR